MQAIYDEHNLQQVVGVDGIDAEIVEEGFEFLQEINYD